MLKIYNNIEQRTEEWFKIRAGKFTGSTFHTLFGNGETKENLLLQLASEKITGIYTDDTYINKDIERGIILEDEARIRYEFETNNIVNKIGFAELDEWIGCSPDGLINNDGIIEIKCPKDSIFLKVVVGKYIKPEYKTQMQFNLFVLDRKWCDFVLYNKNFNKCYIQRIERDEEYIKKINEVIKCCKSDILNKINVFNNTFKNIEF